MNKLKAKYTYDCFPGRDIYLHVNSKNIRTSTSRLLTILVILFLINNKSVAQNNLAQFSAGFSRHGTGDLNGVSFVFDYTQYLKKNLAWRIAFGDDIHDGSSPLFYEYPPGNQVDGSYRYTTAGLQAGGGIRYSFMRNDHHELFLNLDGFFRYQSSNATSGVGISYPAITGFPFPIIEIENTSPQRTYSVGAAPRVGYNYTFNKKIVAGLAGETAV